MLIIFLSLMCLGFLLELIVPKGFSVLYAGAAGFIALLIFLFPAAPLLFIVSFFILLIVLLTLSWRIMQNRISLLLIDPHTLKGESFLLAQRIHQGQGKTVLQGALWYLQCNEDLPAKTKVKITRVDGVLLSIEKLS